jgi:hypothetical protein
VSYSVSVVKSYNATSSLVRFENKKSSMYFEKRSGVVVVNSKGVELA